jgi:hypothetical protein
MSEAASRLRVLKEVLIIFPIELLPIVNGYVKASSHRWQGPTDYERTCLYHYSWESRYVESTDSSDDGPCDWGIKCAVSPEFLTGSYIEFGVVCYERYGPRIARTLCRIDCKSNGSLDAKRTTYVVRADPFEHSVTLCSVVEWMVTGRKESQMEALSNLNWVSFRLFVRLYGDAHVQLVDH